MTKEILRKFWLTILGFDVGVIIGLVATYLFLHYNATCLGRTCVFTY